MDATHLVQIQNGVYQIPSLEAALSGLVQCLTAAAPPPYIYIHAPRNTDFVVNVMVQRFKSSITCPVRLATLNIAEFNSPRAFYQRTLYSLAIEGWVETHRRDTKCDEGSQTGDTSRLPTQKRHRLASMSKWHELLSPQAYESFDDFVEALNLVADFDRNSKGSNVSQFLILENAHRLRDWRDPHWFSAMTRLNEFTRSSVHVIMISPLEWPKVRPSHGITTPILYDFPPMSSPDLSSCLWRTFRDAYPTSPPNDDRLKTLGALIHLVVEIFGALASFELAELERILHAISSRCCWDATAHSQVLATNRHLFEEYRLAFGSPTPSHPPSSLLGSASPRPNREKEFSIHTIRDRSHPLCANWILVAAYIASYNHHKTDVRNVSSAAEENRRRGARKQKGTTTTTNIAKVHVPQSLLGPRQFTLERLLAIFEALCTEQGLRFSSSCALHNLSALMRRRLILRTTGVSGAHADRFDGIRLKSGLLFTDADTIAKRLGFDLANRLWEQHE